MENVGVAFTILTSGDKAPLGWTKSSNHIVFGVKMDFTRKAMWVKGFHCIPDPTTSIYSGVLLCDIIRIAMTYAALMGLDSMADDIKNS